MFGPLSSTIQGVVNFTWPMVLISTVIIVSLRISYILKIMLNLFCIKIC